MWGVESVVNAFFECGILTSMDDATASEYARHFPGVSLQDIVTFKELEPLDDGCVMWHRLAEAKATKALHNPAYRVHAAKATRMIVVMGLGTAPEGL
jgi:hypothetical protein